ncbi:MAG TPA: type II toxin-antitoxin system Phd/YefM family antitoxin [Kiritimatiellia bacterium]|nr:type II toxin-antitoxin system Phd/YefM family antitoxin [Kiritimatiellia bacterium]HMO97651.1 type II toxin-antitoxin system Phd/YefM family antitoxin [Kiritimatiellia bacterium]HMP95512.1 type II toxin-antitoxin system Phd/YefM family antitoxin [Kiritimatiellia bacterium]
MITIPFTEFRRNASNLLDRVEKGESLLLVRHGRPIAEILPVSTGDGHIPSWKRPGIRLTAKGTRLSSAIIEDRTCEDVL